MIVKLATFTKRENSTKVFGDTWLEFDCVLKERCSVINPIFELQTTTNLSAINYARIDAFNRFYFVSVSYERDTVILTMTCDVMATYKSQIGASSEYVLRAASDYDGDIIDTLYPTKADNSFVAGSAHDVFSDENISYVIGIINNTTTDKFGAVKYYLLDGAQLGRLMSYLLGQDVINDTGNLISTLTTELQNGIVRALSNPTQFIVESYALPYTPDLSGSDTLTIGWWITDITASIVAGGDFYKQIDHFTLTLPSHPQANSRGHYLSAAPYTHYWLYLGPFGVYQLDATQAINAPNVELYVYGDPFGNVACDIVINSAVIDTLHASVKNNFPIAQVSIDALGVAQGAIDFIAAGSKSADMENFGDLDKVATGILSAVKTLQPKVSRQGTQGSFMHCFEMFVSYAEFFEVVDDDNTHRGRPLCQERTISSLSGYILVGDADISTAGTKEETQQIKNYMNSGFYYE